MYRAFRAIGTLLHSVVFCDCMVWRIVLKMHCAFCRYCFGTCVPVVTFFVFPRYPHLLHFTMFSFATLLLCLIRAVYTYMDIAPKLSSTLGLQRFEAVAAPDFSHLGTNLHSIFKERLGCLPADVVCAAIILNL